MISEDPVTFITMQSTLSSCCYICQGEGHTFTPEEKTIIKVAANIYRAFIMCLCCKCVMSLSSHDNPMKEVQFLSSGE